MKHQKDENQIIKDEIVKDIKQYILNYEIKSIQQENRIIDTTNIHLLDSTKNIHISNKYIPLLCETYSLQDVLNSVSNNNYDVNVINNKYIGFNIGNHSVFQMLKRFIYIYTIHQDFFEFSVEMLNTYEKYKDLIIKILSSTNTDKNKAKELAISIMEEILYKSKVLTKDTVNSPRDKRLISLRNKEHYNTIRYFQHPFVFIVEDIPNKGRILKTVELYSSSFECDSFNKLTKSKEFNTWFKNTYSLNSSTSK